MIETSILGGLVFGGLAALSDPGRGPADPGAEAAVSRRRRGGAGPRRALAREPGRRRSAAAPARDPARRDRGADRGPGRGRGARRERLSDGRLAGRLIRDKNAAMETALAGLDQLRARMRALEQMGDPAEARRLFEQLGERVDALQAARARRVPRSRSGSPALKAQSEAGPQAALAEQFGRLYAQKDAGLAAMLAQLGPGRGTARRDRDRARRRIAGPRDPGRARGADRGSAGGAGGGPGGVAALEPSAPADRWPSSASAAALHAQKDALAETLLARIRHGRGGAGAAQAALDRLSGWRRRRRPWGAGEAAAAGSAALAGASIRSPGSPTADPALCPEGCDRRGGSRGRAARNPAGRDGGRSGSCRGSPRWRWASRSPRSGAACRVASRDGGRDRLCCAICSARRRRVRPRRSATSWPSALCPGMRRPRRSGPARRARCRAWRAPRPVRRAAGGGAGGPCRERGRFATGSPRWSIRARTVRRDRRPAGPALCPEGCDGRDDIPLALCRSSAARRIPRTGWPRGIRKPRFRPLRRAVGGGAGAARRAGGAGRASVRRDRRPADPAHAPRRMRRSRRSSPGSAARGAARRDRGRAGRAGSAAALDRFAERLEAAQGQAGSEVVSDRLAALEHPGEHPVREISDQLARLCPEGCRGRDGLRPARRSRARPPRWRTSSSRGIRKPARPVRRAAGGGAGGPCREQGRFATGSPRWSIRARTRSPGSPTS